ncbi:hypothetical protein CHRY9390_01305 [Chryseobacterium aquaeductus]|uniref:Uncharacterized protein n=1 Tax=Chryseobacterium aquaeductus TaxID=2675056 RepID=A0A9N8MF32_9FLAO|nr:hypothetical protein CHRY9390_01305 [Chryseobacterium potabilaquae]CAD7805007.1 hypothetical protein CHRY9390_01305 [Chryseobacterium aquaeductus]
MVAVFLNYPKFAETSLNEKFYQNIFNAFRLWFLYR